MSSLPDVPLGLFKEYATRFDIALSDGPHGILVMQRGDDRYPLIPFEGFARGLQIMEACRVFGIDPFDFIAGEDSRAD